MMFLTRSKQNFCLLKMLLVITVLTTWGVTLAFAQDADNLIHIEWDEPPQVINKEIQIDFTQEQQAELMENVNFTSNGLELSASSTSGTFTSQKIQIPIDNPEPFLSVVAKWIPEVDTINFSETREITNIIVSLRNSENGITWNEWFDIVIDDDMEVDDTEFFSDIIWFDNKTRYIQYRIVLRESHQKAPVIRSFELFFTSPGKTPKYVLDGLQNIAQDFTQPPVGEIYLKPPVVSRTTWGCPDGQESPEKTPKYSETITHLFVHHTAGNSTLGSHKDWPSVLRAIYSYHKNTKKWGDIAYNYLIDRDGVVYEGRAGGDNVIGRHNWGFNPKSMGVSLIGNFQTAEPSLELVNSLIKILAWKADQQGIDPLGVSDYSSDDLIEKGEKKDLWHIAGHRDSKPTSCPGKNIYELLPSIRETVNFLISGLKITKFERSSDPIYAKPNSSPTHPNFWTRYEVQNTSEKPVTLDLALDIHRTSPPPEVKTWTMFYYPNENNKNVQSPSVYRGVHLQPGDSKKIDVAWSYFQDEGRFRVVPKAILNGIEYELAPGAGYFDVVTYGYTCDTFPDVKGHDWFCKYVEKLSEVGIIKGYGNTADTECYGKFCPARSINRSEFLKIALSVAYWTDSTKWKWTDQGGIIPRPEPGEHTFSDVPEDVWYAPYVQFALRKGILDPKDKFYPGNPSDPPLNRAEAVKILVECGTLDDGNAYPPPQQPFQKLKRYKESFVEPTTTPLFSDVEIDKQNLWYYNYVYACADQQFLHGYKEDHTFRPENPINRAEVAKIMAINLDTVRRWDEEQGEWKIWQWDENRKEWKRE